MRILFVTNHMPPNGCGVASWGEQQEAALRAAGMDVTHWESWPPIYLPDNAKDFDVIYLNWHCLTLGHVQAQHIPEGPLVCGYIHEYSPSWEETGFPDIWKRLDVRLVEEEIPSQDCIPFMLPVPDYVPKQGEVSDPSFCNYRGSSILIGHTGLRGDGLDRLIPACEKNGWKLTTSKDNNGWIPLEQEIERLAKCHLVVVHSHGGWSGQASAASTAMAARRPLLINSGRMLKYVKHLNEKLYGGSQLYCIEDVEEGIKTVLKDISAGTEKIPNLMAQDFSWKSQTARLIKIWKERLGK